LPPLYRMATSKNMKTGINPDFSVKSRKTKDLSYYISGLQNKNRYVLSECITLLESTNEEKRRLAETILDAIPNEDDTVRIGITGSPGVGKSTFLETFGLFLLQQKHSIAILAIDPSSQKNKGSILGDKTRMQHLAVHNDAFIRPSPAGNVLGGTAAYTKEAIQLCEAAGFDFIIVETVGVGQSEIEVDNITDINILLLQPGAGDDIQGIKRGIVENADIFIINKADGPQLELAKQTRNAYTNAIQLFHHDIKGWICPVLLTSAIENTGMEQVYESILQYISLLKQNGQFNTRRQSQENKWFEKQTIEKFYQMVSQNTKIADEFLYLAEQIKNAAISTREAIHRMEVAFKTVIKTED
jgi:LAO/AO transport system kinase